MELIKVIETDTQAPSVLRYAKVKLNTYTHTQTNQQTTQDELQWIVAQRLLSALTIPGFS